MIKKRLGALVLTLALGGAVAVPATIGLVQAANARSAASLAEEFPQDIAALEESYEALLPTLRTSDPEKGAVRGADTYGALSNGDVGVAAAHYWNKNDIDPDFDNVTISYKYASTKATSIGSYGFGFRFSLGNKHVAILRFQRSLTIVQFDKTGEPVNVKISADPYFSTTINVLGSAVNTGKYETVAVASTASDAGNGTQIFGKAYSNAKPAENKNFELSGGMPALTAGVGVYGASGSTNVCMKDDTISVVHTLRKVTEGDTVSYRFYEDGNYYCSFEFEEGVTGFAPHLANPDKDHLVTSEYEVKLGDPYTEYDREVDASSATKSAFLEVGDSVTYTFTRRAQSNPGPAISFAYGDNAWTGMVVLRFSQRLHLTAWTNGAKSGTRTFYVQSNPEKQNFSTSKAAGDYDNFPDGSVITIKSDDDGKQDIAQNHTSNRIASATADASGNAGYESDRLTYRIVRLPNETHDGTEFAMYAFYENDEGFRSNNGELYLSKLGFPLNEITNGKGGVTVHARLNSATTPDYLLTMTSSKMEADAANPEKNPERDLDGEVNFEEWNASSVRYTVDSQGLRFTATLSKDLVSFYEANYTNVEFGIKLVRDEGGADEASAFIRAINRTEEGGKYLFNGVVTNIPASRYTTKYTPYVYLKFTDGSNVEHVILTEKGTAKSIREVAEEMLATPTGLTDAQKAILQKYVG